MNTASLTREEMRCDVNRCTTEHDQTPDKKVGVLIGGALMLFCPGHCQRLSEEGVALQTIEVLTRRLKATEVATLHLEQYLEDQGPEEDFINALKECAA